MEREIRNKFVLITMSLMCLVFGIFFTATHFYYQYWFDMDTLQFIEWITESGVLLNEPLDSAGRELIDEQSEYDSLIAVIVSESGEIMEYRYNLDNQKISQKIVNNILSRSGNGWKTGSYIYAIKHLSDKKCLIVLADTKKGENTPLRYIISILMIVAGIFILSWITLYLSRFVTNPAKSAMLREKQFISDASHELKTPLGAISINAQALISMGEDNKHIQNIISESERMSRLIERLLTLSKIDENADIPKTVFSLSSCVEEMALTYESVAYDKQIGYDYEIAENISFYGNEDDIRQLMAILIDNAIKNTEPEGSIQIVLTEHKGHFLLKVQNTGKEIAPEDLPHIFERFYKADSARSENSFGLGLAIAKAVTERNHGIISAESEQNGLTCFTLEFK